MQIIHGDCLIALRTQPDNSIESLVTDPPSSIGFMNMKWDKDKGGRDQWIAWLTEVMEECLRVLKPGAHGLVWALPRTSHWTATALEDAGFEIRESLIHLFGSGYPKSTDVGKAIDKAAGVKRQDILADQTPNMDNEVYGKGLGVGIIERRPVTDAAKQWNGWGTALKPGHEVWFLIRKPFAEKTLAVNVLEHGVGGINIDANRAEPHDGAITGRWPSSVLLSHAECGEVCEPDCPVAGIEAQGGVAEFFSVIPGTGYLYTPKAPTRERPTGPDGTVHMTVKSLALMKFLTRMVCPPGGTILDPFAGSGTTVEAALLEGFDCIAMEAEAAYIPLIEARVARCGLLAP